jgi:predicted exporter
VLGSSSSPWRSKYLLMGLIGIVIAVSAFGLAFISFDNSIETMLPGNDEVFRTIRFFRESNLSDKVLISLGIESSSTHSIGGIESSTHSTRDLIRAADQLAESLRPPLVTEVMRGISEVEILGEIDTFLTYCPQLLNQKDLSRIEQSITPEGVKARLARNFQQLMTPASSFTMPFIRSDPLGIKTTILHNLNSLYTSLGYEVTLEGGHFISKDGRHVLLILQTPVVMTDGFGSRKLRSYLYDRLKSLPGFVSADIISGHLHTVSNEEVMKRDVRMMTIIASIAFFLLFLIFFRDIRATAVFLLPLATTLVSTNLSFLVFKKLSYVVIGMGAVVIGFVMDYGIYVYTAIVRSKDNPSDVLKKIAMPVIAGALTTIAIFVAFFFSHVQGYHQLAFFSIISITLCILGAFFILPHLLLYGKDNRHAQHESSLLAAVARNSCFTHSAISDKIKITFWGIIIIFALVFCSRLTFTTDINQFDGSGQKIFQAERRFHQIWGGKDSPAVLVASGKNLEEALERNEHIYGEAATHIDDNKLCSLALLWPSKKTREKNAKQWVQFWKQGNEAKLRNLLLEHGRKYHFSKDAFSPFFDGLYKEAVVKDELEKFTSLRRLKERFIMKGENRYQVLSFFPDKDHDISAIKALCNHYPGTFIVSRNNLSQVLSQSIFSEIVYLSAIAALLILVVTYLLLRSIRLTILSLVPVVTAVAVALGIMPALGLSLNPVNIMAAMIVVGLTSDYGIFMVYACKGKLSSGTRTAISLSAITTLIGAGVLLFARHPVLFSIGLTMVAGVFSGYISSLVVIPALYPHWIKGESEHVCGD